LPGLSSLDGGRDEKFFRGSPHLMELCLAVEAFGSGVGEGTKEIGQDLLPPAHESVSEGRQLGKLRERQGVGEARQGVRAVLARP